MGEMTVRRAVADDIDAGMKLVEQVKNSFSGLETEQGMVEHRATVLDFMARG